MEKGLSGMVRGKDFANDLAILLDKEPSEEAEYLYAALVGSGDLFFAIRMSPAVFHGIRRGDPMARTCLFHELGHYVRKHLLTPGFQTEDYDRERYFLASEGKVIRQELEADAFAAEYLGCDVVAGGLCRIRSLHEKSLGEGTYDPEGVAVAMRELNSRIEKLRHGSE